MTLTLAAACSRGAPPDPESPSAAPTAESKPEDTSALAPRDVIDLASIDSTEGLKQLAPLAQDARVVLLGEASHGDGATVHAISSLVRALHEELGFEVFALESGLYDCAVAWKRARDGDAGRDVAEACAFRNWRETQPMLELWDYLAAQASSEAPMILAGFDNQFSGARGEAFVDDLVATLEAHGVRDSLPDGWLADLESAMPKLASSPPPSRTPDARERHRAAIEAALAAMRSAAPLEGHVTSKWLRILEGLAAVEKSRWHDFADLRPMGLRSRGSARLARLGPLARRIVLLRRTGPTDGGALGARPRRHRVHPHDDAQPS